MVRAKPRAGVACRRKRAGFAVRIELQAEYARHESLAAGINQATIKLGVNHSFLETSETGTTVCQYIHTRSSGNLTGYLSGVNDIYV